jgi:hypothetical protein
MKSARSFAFVASVGLLLGGCSGNGTTSPNPQAPVSTNTGITAGPMNETNGPVLDAKNTTNKRIAGVFTVLGQAINNDQSANDNAKQDSEDTTTAHDTAIASGRGGTGVCRNGFEFNVNYNDTGNPVSTEAKYFFNRACTELARDVVRTWMPGASAGSETVLRTATNYAVNDATPIAVRTSTLNYSNGSFDKLGYTYFSPGFHLESSNQLKIGTTKSISSDFEMVMEPAASGSNVNEYCTDSAGFNEIPVVKLNEEFGWSGGAFGSPVNTRTQLAKHEATWVSTHTGTAYSGAVGALSINAGSANSTCPITAPLYTLVGGTSNGTYTIPVTVTFDRGVIRNLTVTNASLRNGDTLNVSTNTNLLPTAPDFIRGTITSGSTTVATFDVNAFGQGILTVTKTGNQFVISDWHVIR